MNYLDYFKKALEQFERDLKEDTIRLNGIYNELEMKKKEKEVLSVELRALEDEHTSILDQIKAERIEHEQSCERLKNEADKVLKEAHLLFSEAQATKKNCDNERIELEKMRIQVENAKIYWEKKVHELNDVMGVA
jgi:peptidoglycan hydrolase CwlO-like protein